MYAGDVRKVLAVDPSSRLRSVGGYSGQLLVDNYVNVVVFSQQGSRPLPNMLSGSDLVSQYLWCWSLQLLGKGAASSDGISS